MICPLCHQLVNEVDPKGHIVEDADNNYVVRCPLDLKKLIVINFNAQSSDR